MITHGFDQPATRIDIYIAAMLQGSIERGRLNLYVYDDDVSQDDRDIIQRITKLAIVVDEIRDEFEGYTNQ